MKSDWDCGRSDVEVKQSVTEGERKKLQVKKVYQLESLLKRTQEECSSLREHYQRLREDFKFNLSILDDQNKELEKYDAVIVRALTVEDNGCMVPELLSQTEKCDMKKLVQQQRITCLEEELVRRKQDHLQVTEALKASKTVCQKLQTQLKSKEREMTDIMMVKDQRIKKLKDELKWRKSKQTKLENEHNKKCEDLVWTLKKRDAQLEALCKAHNEEMLKTEEYIVNLQKNMDALAVQARCAQEQQQKAVVEKDEIIQRYKQQLSAALIREREFEQIRVQKELEWQNRYEDIKAEQHLTNEQLIQDLTEARDQAQANLKEKEEELKNLSVFFHSVRAGKDQAIQVDSPASETNHHLQEQNNTLRAVVSQMRKDMEKFGCLGMQSQAEPQASSTQQIKHQLSSADPSIIPPAAFLIPTGEPAQSVNVSFNFSPAGDNANNCTWTKQAKVVHAQSPLVNVTEQGVSVQQLQEKNLNVQQQTSSVMSLGVLENTHLTKSNGPLMYARLKQAASCITRLSREKQKLIEMGNCLRAQIVTDQPQDSVKLERDLPEKRPGVRHDRLSVLEQLQYQLTTQELQYALKQNTGTVTGQLLQKTNQRGPYTDGPGSISQPHTTTESCKNKENNPGVPSSVWARSLCSSQESQQSLQVLWEMLDDGLSISHYSEDENELGRKEVAESGGTRAQMEEHVHGATHPEVQQRRNPANQSGAACRRTKIRNYNVKD